MSAIFYKNLPYGAGGSNVEANPSGSATDDLEKIGIDGTVYDVTDADAARNIPTFSEASTRANLSGSGETMATILGKIKKWFTDLKDLAFIGKDGNNSKKYLRGDGTWQSIFEGSVVGDIQIKDNDSGFTTTIYAVNDSLTGLNLLNVPDKSGTIATTNDIPDVETAKTATGNPITLTDASESYAEELEVTLEPIQSGSGTPSPSNIRPITGYTEVNVGSVGKNLLNPLGSESSPKTNNGITFTVNNDGSITCNGTATAQARFYFDSSLTFPFDVIYSCENSNSSKAYCYAGSVISSTGKTISANTSVGTNFIAVNNGNTVSNYTVKPMIRQADISDTTFEPYKYRSVSTPLGRTVYGGKLNVRTGELVVDRAVKTITGSESGATITWDSYSFKVNDGIDSNSEIGVYESSYSDDALTGSEMYSSRASGHDYGYCVGSGQIMRIRNRNLTQDLASYQTWFQSNTIQVCYKLATPQNYQLTPQELKLLKQYNYITTNGTTISLKYQPDNVIGEAIGVSEEYTDRKIYTRTLLNEFVWTEPDNTRSLYLCNSTVKPNWIPISAYVNGYKCSVVSNNDTTNYNWLVLIHNFDGSQATDLDFGDNVDVQVVYMSI